MENRQKKAPAIIEPHNLSLESSRLPLLLKVIWGIMEKKMETTIVYWGLYGDNGKENGNYNSILQDR